MREKTLYALLLLIVTVACGCTPPPAVDEARGAPSPRSTSARFALPPPLLSPSGQLRLVATSEKWMRAEDVATGAILWSWPARIPAAVPTVRWRVLFSHDGTSLYVQSLSAEPGLTYQGTRRVEPRTGAELANDLKFEDRWYENVVLWTALGHDGKLQMAVRRPATAGGGYKLRTLDPMTLKILTEASHSAPPAIP